MTTNEQRALEAMNEHYYDVMGAPSYSSPPNPIDYLNVLSAAGLITPDLPEPMQGWEAERTGGTPGSRWYGYEDDGNDDGSGFYSPHRYIDTYPDEVWLDGTTLLDADGAEAYALRLLAAARHARNTKENHDE